MTYVYVIASRSPARSKIVQQGYDDPSGSKLHHESSGIYFA
jgi:hypothetical protein